MIKRITQLLVTVLLYILGSISAIIPFRIRLILGKLLGYILMLLNKTRKLITLNNISLSFLEKSPDWHKKVMAESYRNLGIVLAEVPIIKNIKIKNIDKFISYENIEMISELYSQGRGLILMSGHYGNWELLAYSAGLLSGIPVTIVVKTQANPYVDRFLNQIRTSANNEVVSMDNAARVIVSALKQKKVIALLADQAVYGGKPVFVDFFGRLASTFEAPAALALKYNVPIIIGFANRNKDGKYNVQLNKIEHEGMPYNEENIRILTRKHVKILEDNVREHPGLWAWQHRRWKHTP